MVLESNHYSHPEEPRSEGSLPHIEPKAVHPFLPPDKARLTILPEEDLSWNQRDPSVVLAESTASQASDSNRQSSSQLGLPQSKL